MSKDVSFVARMGDNGWVVRLSHNEMGETPVGPRLAKGSRYPSEIGVVFDEKSEAEQAAKKWEEWYFSQPYLTKKRKAKYIA